MTKQTINVGATANDKQGDSLRAAFQKVNANFTELYTALGLDSGGLNLGAFEFTGSTLSTTDSTAITIDQSTTVTSDLTVGGDILPQIANSGDLGSLEKPWRSLYVSNNTIYIGGTALGISDNGDLTLNGQIFSPDYANIDNAPTIPTDISDLTDTTNLLSGNGSDPVFDTVTAVDGFYGEHTPQVGYQFTTGFFAATGDIYTTTTYWTLWMDSSYDALVAAGDKTGWTLRSNLAGTNTVTITSYNYSVVGGFKRIDITTSANLTYTFDATQMIWTSPDYAAAVNGPVTLHAGSKEWTFATNGITTFPNNLTIESDGAHNLIAQGGSGNLYLDAAGDVVVRGVSNVYIRSDNENFEWGFTDGGILSLPGSTASIYGFTDTLELFADSNSNNGIGVSSSQTNVINSGAVRIVSDTDGNEHTWTFGADGTLTLPGTGTIRTAYGAMSINAPSGSSNLSIKSNDATTYMIVGNGSAGVTAGSYNWQFSNTGNLTFPDNTVQRTAWTGVGDIRGSVFADDSTRIIDGTDGSVYANRLRTTEDTISLGSLAGATNQGLQSVAIGNYAGYSDQDIQSVAIGNSAGSINQGQRAVAIGSLAGSINQGDYAVALGNFAGGTNQPANSILINASGQALNGSAAGFFVDPIRNIDGGAFLNYNTSTKEIGYSNDIRSDSNINIDINLTDSTLRRWQFGEDGDLRIPGDITSRQSTNLNLRSGYSVSIVTDWGDNDRTWLFDGTSGTLELPADESSILFGDSTEFNGTTVTMPTTTNGVPNSFVWEFSDNLVGGDTITLNWNLLATEQGGFYFGTTHSTNGKYLFLDGNNQSLGYIPQVGADGGGKLIFGATAGNNAGDVNAIELKAADGDVYLTSTESVKITVDAADSSARVWTFDPTGTLNLPGSIQLSSGGIIAGNDSVQNGITIGASDTNSTTTMNGDVFFMDDAYFTKAVQEKFQELADATGTVNHDCSQGHIFYHASPDANWTVNLTNFTLTTNYATTITIIIDQDSTGYYPNALQIGGSAQTINWQGNTTPTPSTNRQDVVTFSILAVSGGYIVFGQLTGF